MNDYSRLPDDLILSVIHEIEQEKFISDLPDRVYVTPQETVAHINKKRKQLQEDYGNLDFSELKKTCELAEDAIFDECLDALTSKSNCIVVSGQKIPKPLFKIVEKLWQDNQIIVFPSKAYPKDVKNFFDRTCPEYSDIEEFINKNYKVKPKQLRKEIDRLLDMLDTSSHNGIRFRSKIFEIIRLLPQIRYTPQINYNCQRRYRKNPFDKLWQTPNVSSVKYVQERKSLPPRNIAITDFFSKLREIVKRGHTCPLTNEKKFIKRTCNSTKLLESIDLVEKTFEDPDVLGKDGAFSDFQKNSTLHIFLNIFIDDTNCGRWCNEETCHLSRRNLTIVADTGAGKTLAFIIAPLIYITYKHLEDPSFRVAQKPICILIYPRRDLAFDQDTTLQKICSVLNRITEGKVRINVGRDYGGKIEYDGSLVACNIEAIKRRLADPVRSKYFDPEFLKIIVLDEIHLYSGILGLHVLYFLRRLGASLKEKNYKRNHSFKYVYPQVIGASATIAIPEKHSQKLFSLGYDRAKLKESMDRYRKIWVENAIDQGQKGKRALFHHIFMLPKKFANLLGTMTDLTVGVLHNNPDLDYPQLYRETDEKAGEFSEKEMNKIVTKIDKSLLFIDSISAINRLHYYISDTEKRNLQVMDVDAPVPSRNYMCSVIYDKPIKFFPTFNILNIGGTSPSKSGYIPELKETEEGHRRIEEGPLICQFCKKQYGFKNISLEAYLKKGRDVCAVIQYNGRLELVTILDGCLFHSGGLCWWFSDFPFVDKHHSALQIDPPRFTLDAILPFRRTAQLRGLPSARPVEKLDELFVDFLDEPPYMQRKRLAIVSPVFEVGVDISNVKDVITFKTIRDMASYRQKTGRGGREYFSDIPVYTLISQRILDRYIYRNPDIIADPTYLDPISLKEHNWFFLKTHVFMAIFDFLSIWSREYSEIYHFSNLTRNTDLKKNNLLKYLEENEGKVRNYIRFAFSFYATQNELSELISNAIKEFKDRLNLFCTDLPIDLRTKLGISKPISHRRIDRRSLLSLTGKSKDPKEVLQRLKILLEV